MEEIFKRRSVRDFKNMPVEEEKCEKILRAAMAAPSAGNQQPWEFIVVKNPDTLLKLADCSPYAGCVKKAPMAIVVLGNDSHLRFPEYWQIDLSTAIENILLEAVHLELGAVWLGIAPLEERMEAVSKLFELPENLHPFAIVPVGYPDKELAGSARFDRSRIHYEKLD